MKTISALKILVMLSVLSATAPTPAATLSACEEIKKEISGRKRNSIMAARLSKLIDQLTQKQSVLSDEDLACVVREAETLDKEDLNGQLSEQLNGFAEDQPQAFAKALKGLDSVQRAHVQKMIEEARKLMEGGNG